MAEKKKKFTKEEMEQKKLEMHASLFNNQVILYLMRSFMFTEKEFYEVRRVPWKRAKKVRWDKVLGFVKSAFTDYHKPTDLGLMKIVVSPAIKPYLNKFSRQRCGVDMNDYPEFYDKEFIPMSLRNTFLTMLNNRAADIVPAAMAHIGRNDQEAITLKFIHMPNYMMKRFCMARKEPVPIYAVSSHDMKEAVYDAMTSKGRKGDFIDRDTGLYDDSFMKKGFQDLKRGLFDIPVSVLSQAFEKMGPFRILTSGGMVYFIRKEIIGSSFEVPDMQPVPLGSKSKEDFRFSEAWTVTAMGDQLDEYSIGLDIPVHFKGTFRELWTMFGTLGAMQENANNRSNIVDGKNGKPISSFAVTPEMILLLKAVVFTLMSVSNPEEIVSKYNGKTDGGTAADYIDRSECSGKQFVTTQEEEIQPLMNKIIKEDRSEWYTETKGDTKLQYAFYTDDPAHIDKVRAAARPPVKA